MHPMACEPFSKWFVCLILCFVKMDLLKYNGDVELDASFCDNSNGGLRYFEADPVCCQMILFWHVHMFLAYGWIAPPVSHKKIIPQKAVRATVMLRPPLESSR